MLTLIVARARQNAIGRNGTMPWSAPEDLRMFQQETLGGALVMGRRTWESLPVRPLKGRLSHVVTRSQMDGVSTFDDPVKAVIEASRLGHTRVYGIGGASIYSALMPYAHRLLITDIDLDVPDADTWFPGFSDEVWSLGAERLLRAESPLCTLREYIRREPSEQLPKNVPDRI